MNNNSKLPIIPLFFPWKDSNGKILNLFQLYSSRFFTINFLIIIWTFWFLFGDMSTIYCITPNEKIGCSAAIWHKNWNSPAKYFISFFTAPFFYNSEQHIRFTTISFLIFVQSFEAKVGSLNTIKLFFITNISISILGGITSNFGSILFPELEIFSYMLERNWMGASGAFMGIIGAMSHLCRFRLLFPIAVLFFESWNFFINGISLSISITHVIGCVFGYCFWKAKINRNNFGLLSKTN